MAEFVPNPDFMPQLERAVMRELDDILEEAFQDVRRNLTPAAIVSKVGLRTTPAKRTGRLEVGVFIGYSRGLGPIFETGTKPRYTKGRGRKGKYPAGVHRGQITTANHAMRNARDNVMRRGLSLHYL